MFIISIKRYLKTPILICLTALWSCYYIYSLLHAQYFDSLQMIENVLNKIEVSFLFFLFISYVYQSKSRQVCFDETLSGISSGMFRQAVSQITVLLLVSAAVSVWTFIYMYQQMESFQVLSYTMLIYLVKLVIIHQFLPHLLAIFLGLAVSGMKSETVAYCVLVGFYLLFNKKNIGLLESLLVGQADWLARIPRFLNLYSQRYSGINNYYYIFSVENINFQRIGAWLGIVAAIILCQKLPHRKKCFSAGLFLVSTCCLGLYLQPSSDIYLGDGETDFWVGDSIYYSFVCKEKIKAEDEQPEDFKLTSMQADFTADRLLKAEVTLGIDRPDLKQYCFTLYHGYRIKKVEDQTGNPLMFRQDGDYLTVESAGADVTSLTFSYSGFNAHCYSTSQGIFLPAYLEYYPVPGFQTVYIQTPGYYGYTMEGLGYDVDCQITVHTKQNVYSNLPSDGKNCFKGKCDAVSLYAGEFMKETMLGNCRLLYSPLSFDGMEAEVHPEAYGEFIRWYEKQSGDKLELWCLPAGGNPEYYFGKGQVMGDYRNLQLYYEKYQMTGDWYQTLSEEQLKEIEQLRKEVEQLEQQEESGK